MQGLTVNFYLKGKDVWLDKKIERAAESSRISRSELFARMVIEYFDNHPEYDEEAK